MLDLSDAIVVGHVGSHEENALTLLRSPTCDIESSAKAVIAFLKASDFTVLCGIHPKMKLTVQVR